MIRESAEAKARRYLVEGRVWITCVDGDFVRALVRGAGELHEAGHRPRDGWYCTCPARRTCAHLHALMAVTVKNGLAGR